MNVFILYTCIHEFLSSFPYWVGSSTYLQIGRPQVPAIAQLREMQRCVPQRRSRLWSLLGDESSASGSQREEAKELGSLHWDSTICFYFPSDQTKSTDPQQTPSKVWLKAMETFSIQGKLYDMKKSPNNIKTFFSTILPDLSKDLDMTNILSTPKKSQRVNFDTARCGDEEVALRICAWCDCQVFKLTLATLGNTSHTCCIWTDFAAVLHSTRFVCQETGFIASKRQNIRGSLVKLSGTTK